MPSLGTDMQAGTLVEWQVKPGDHVKRGDIIAAVETEKGIIEIEVFESGQVEQLLVQPGEEVPVGAVLATIRYEGAGVIATAPEVKPLPSPEEPSLLLPPPVAPPIEPAAPVAVAPRLRVSPLARRLATQLGVDLRTVQGTGPHGAIERADVERAVAPKGKDVAPAAAAAPVAEKSKVFAEGMRQAIARAMARSNREIPHYYLETPIDLSKALRWLEVENQKRSIKERLLPVVMLLKAVARALGDVPELNGYWMDDRLQPQEAINIGFAIALRQGGLITPAIPQVDLKSLDDIMEAIRDLITRTRSGRLRSSEMTEATITMTSLGDLGVEKVFGVIYPPQVALVGFGKITERPWAENGMLGVRPLVTATLAADHRATDGRRGAQFLDALNHYLQEAATL